MKKQLITFSLLSGMLIMSSCEGEDLLEGLNEAEQKLSEHYIECEGAISNVYKLTEQVLRTVDLQSNDSATFDGALVYLTGSHIVVDYGTGVIGSDGLTRKGKILMLQTGDYFQNGGQLNLSFDQFSVDEKAVLGTLGLTNNGTQLALAVDSFSVNDAFSLSTSKTIVWSQGFDTKNDASDDRYNISGTASGNDDGGNSIATTITSPLSYDGQCEFGIVSGVIDMTFAVDTASASTGSLDFLDSDGCDNVVKINIEANGTSVELTKQFNGF